jgi:hypothetical protein
MNLNDELERNRLEVQRNYSASLMSDSKWRALFEAVAASGIEIRGMIVKFVGVGEEKFIAGVSFQAPLPFIDTLEFGPVPLIAIEWLEFPKAIIDPCKKATLSFEQDIAAIRAVLEATGKQFPFENLDCGLRVIGHLR